MKSQTGSSGVLAEQISGGRGGGIRHKRRAVDHRYNPKDETGTMFGLIGGYEGGGRYQWASYSPYFGAAARALYERAETPPAPSATESVTTAYHPPRPPLFH
jgi:hypothetical protein